MDQRGTIRVIPLVRYSLFMLLSTWDKIQKLQYCGNVQTNRIPRTICATCHSRCARDPRSFLTLTEYASTRTDRTSASAGKVF